MDRPLRTLPIVLAAVFLIVAAGVAAVALGAREGERLLAAAGTMESQLLRQVAAVEGGAATTPERFDALGRPFERALAEALSETAAGSPERDLVLAQGDLVARWRSAVRSDRTGERAALLDRFAERGAELRERLLRARAASGRRLRHLVLLVVLGFAALVLAAGALAVTRGWRRHRVRASTTQRQLLDDRRHRAEQEEFTRALQGARTEREAQRMLKAQLERTLADSSATVLNRNNSANRLEAVTSLPADSPLATTVPDAEPGDCLAVRFGQPQVRAAGSSPLLSCELCGGLAGSATCVPSLVGGEVIGSVLIETPNPLDDGGQHRLADAVAHAAPVLSSMRNLRLAETRASTDALTGMPYCCSAEESLKRMLAQAARGNSPCAVAMLDLDQFKKVNDVYGHEQGDQLLAAVGDIATTTVRASDLVARFGGEEFLVVLPDTDIAGALVACEQLRAAIHGLRLPGLGKSPSASIGVAVFPNDGPDGETLMRAADRALYAAKAAGRNCVRAAKQLDDERASSTPPLVEALGDAQSR